MWSNDAVADDDPDEESPWTRDDWVPDSTVPDAGMFGGGSRRPDGPARDATSGGAVREPPPEDFDDEGVHGGSSRSTLGRKVVAGAIVLALLIGSAGALLRDGGAPDDRAPTTTPTTTTTSTTSADDRPPVTLEAIRPVNPPTTVLAATAPSSGSAGDVVEIADEIPPVVVGEPPVWAERTIPVPETMATVGPTEVITLSQSGIVNVTEFPSGRTRSVDVSAIGAQLQLAVGDGTIVVFDSTTLVQIRDGEPVVETPLLDGIIFVQPWMGTGTFIATAPAIGSEAPQQEWVLRPDGTLELLDNPFVDEGAFFSRMFSPDGDALVSAPGGVYAIDPTGAARRISSGTLVATGARHWAVEECDDTLRCAYSVVEWETGAVTPGALEVIDDFGFIDPATHISPDGRSITYRAESSDGTGGRRILDVATGNSLEAGRINQFVYPDSWAMDSSGVFITDRLLRFVDRTTGAITEIDGLDSIRSVATGAFSR